MPPLPRAAQEHTPTDREGEGTREPPALAASPGVISSTFQPSPLLCTEPSKWTMKVWKRRSAGRCAMERQVMPACSSSCTGGGRGSS